MSAPRCFSRDIVPLAAVLDDRTGPCPRFAAEQVRQYFKDGTFYVADAEARELCPFNTSSTATSTPLLCEEFDPSAATTKVRYYANAVAPCNGRVVRSRAAVSPPMERKN